MSGELPTARIRPYYGADSNERKTMMRLIAKHEMEALATANRRAYCNPALVLLWLAASSAFVEFMHWWPSQQPAGLGGLWPWFSPVRGYAPFLVVFLVAVDWFNRPYFEERMQASLRSEDRRDGSSFWLLEYDGEIIGLAAIKTREAKATQATSVVADLTHFTVIEPYRPANIQRDLLQHTIRKAFEANDKLALIHAEDDALHPYIQQALHDEGFRVIDGEVTRTMGIMRWKIRDSTLIRSEWERRQADTTKGSAG
ncbi:uncharacterized protein SCHCODRAFT_02487950 [Schizophyllum commune H4-8]|uniref:N-acetyltransferase domain-containing protein n=1 Tax=Schizophyllum commune (strain H4-8 / FGSC 9210) TaxID=578458 RepID=D8PQT9_SCHCM|nr:uncharacterized protein SCHCODRAFT_02487950 [Schizophyllum commune H4-8]KAI5898115.1 hypothetical protein SCHCODRAFT_02487950 [Schizophyllum commune H4-8]